MIFITLTECSGNVVLVRADLISVIRDRPEPERGSYVDVGGTCVVVAQTSAEIIGLLQGAL